MVSEFEHMYYMFRSPFASVLFFLLMIEYSLAACNMVYLSG